MFLKSVTDNTSGSSPRGRRVDFARLLDEEFCFEARFLAADREVEAKAYANKDIQVSNASYTNKKKGNRTRDNILQQLEHQRSS